MAMAGPERLRRRRRQTNHRLTLWQQRCAMVMVLPAGLGGVGVGSKCSCVRALPGVSARGCSGGGDSGESMVLSRLCNKSGGGGGSRGCW